MIFIERSLGAYFRLGVVWNSTVHSALKKKKSTLHSASRKKKPIVNSVLLDLAQLYWLVGVLKVDTPHVQWNFPRVCETTSHRGIVCIIKYNQPRSPFIQIYEKGQNDEGQVAFVVIRSDPASNGWLPFIEMIQDFLALEPRLKDLFNSGQNRIRSYTQVLAGNNCSNNHQATHRIVEEGEEEDRISSLPDEIIHQILARLRSPKQVAQFNTLSRRWPRILSSYSMLLSVIDVESISIQTDYTWKSYLDFHDRILELASEFSPREMDISFGYHPSPAYEIPRGFFSQNGKQFIRLDVLKLKYCRFDLYTDLTANFSCLDSSLKVLCLEVVVFPNEGILHSIIHEASLLETLTLKKIIVTPDWKLQVRNHPNLKFLKVDELCLDLFEIGGIQSLEEVCVIRTRMKEFRIWSTPNVKVVLNGDS
ncbi:hypothetical protein LINPERHAP2_LOCUS1637 [Linum perenne]